MEIEKAIAENCGERAVSGRSMVDLRFGHSMADLRFGPSMVEAEDSSDVKVFW